MICECFVIFWFFRSVVICRLYFVFVTVNSFCMRPTSFSVGPTSRIPFQFPYPLSFCPTPFAHPPFISRLAYSSLERRAQAAEFSTAGPGPAKESWMYGGRGRNCSALTALPFVVWLRYMLYVLYSSFSLALTIDFASWLRISSRLSLNWKHLGLISFIHTLQYQSSPSYARRCGPSLRVRVSGSEMKLLDLWCWYTKSTKRLSTHI